MTIQSSVERSVTVVLLSTVAIAAPLWSQDRCSALNEIIEVIPANGLILKGDTCKEGIDDIPTYFSPKCRIPIVDYKGGDVVYRLRLNEGNQVSFFLDVQDNGSDKDKTDLVLALVSECGKGDKCISSSPDFIGMKDEEISTANYDPGIYYLYVDSWTCGPYELKISGFNPIPSLSAAMTSKAPSTEKSAIAGRPLTYTLTVSNKGTASATNLTAFLTLGDFQQFVRPAPNGCTISGLTISCPMDNIPPPKDGKVSVAKLGVEVEVDPKAETRLSSTAMVKSDSGINAHADLVTPVNHVNDLSIHIGTFPSEAIAGKPRTYVLTLRNDGPSEATSVEATDTLDEDEEFVKEVDPSADPEERCEALDKSHVLCKVKSIPLHGTASRSFEVNVKSSAISLSNMATVRTMTGKEPERNRGPNTDRLDTPLGREADLTIESLTKRGNEEQSGAIPAGADFSYIITVKNLGPSDSSGGTLTFTPDPDLLPSAPTIMAIGPLAAGREIIVPFPLKTLSSFQPRQTSSTVAFARSRIEERDPNPGNNDTRMIKTSFKRSADLELSGGKPTTVSGGDLEGKACAETNLLYSFEVFNHGPSDSSGSDFIDNLPTGLSFVSSPDRCTLELDGVHCPVPALAKDAPPFSFRFVAVPLGGNIDNMAKVQSLDEDEEDENAGNNSIESSPENTPTIMEASDLTTVLTASQETVKAEVPLQYNLDVINNAPTEVQNVRVEISLSDGAMPDHDSDSRCANCDSFPCELKFQSIGAKLTEKVLICATLADPAAVGAVTASARILGLSCNEHGNSLSSATITVSDGSRADLFWTVTSDPKVVTEGDKLTYTISVLNRGFADAQPVEAVVDLPCGVTFIETEVPGMNCTASTTETDCTADTANTEIFQVVRCTKDHLSLNEPVTFVPVVRVDSKAERWFKSTVRVSATPDDPSKGNPQGVLTQRAPALVVPLFEVANDGSLIGLTTLYSVHNTLGVDLESVRYDYIPTSSAPEPDPLSLGPKATKTVNLRQFSELYGVEGYVGITPIDVGDDQRHSLIGDFIRIEPSKGSASGERLISTDTSRKPSEFCESWSTRFLRGVPAGTSTDLLFFVPGNSSNRVVATGKVFAESGAFVQNVEVSSDKEAFLKTINEKNNSDLAVLAGSGSIEWTFTSLAGNDGPIPVVGHITAVHKVNGREEATMPGFCRTGERPGAPSLILPFFEANSAVNTHIAVRNEAKEDIKIKVTYFDELGDPKQNQTISLAEHGTWPVNLRREELPISKGFLQVEALSSIGDTPLDYGLSGDYIRIGPEGLSGTALVDKSSQLCQEWDVRFVQGPQDSSTSFLFYVPKGGAPKGMVYDEDGNSLGFAEFTVDPGSLTSYLVPASALKVKNVPLTGNGSIEWDFGVDAENKSKTGHVTMLFTGKAGEKNYSVLIPGERRCP